MQLLQRKPVVRTSRRRGGHSRKEARRASVLAALAIMLLATALSVTTAAGAAAGVKASVGHDVRAVNASIGLHRVDSSSPMTSPVLWLAPWATPRSSPVARASGDVMYEGFEGATSVFQVAGSPTWNFTDYRADAGAWSAYCAASSIPAPGPYANDMNAWMRTSVDLSGVTSATFSYRLWLNTPESYDHIFGLVSLDGVNYYGDGWWGNTNGWVTVSMDLAAVPTLGNVCGNSTVYFAFAFESDSTVTGEGAYVDEVRVTGSQASATITSLTPNHGLPGATVIIAGSNLGTSGAVRFGSTPASTSNWTATSVTCTVPASLSPGASNVTVTPSGGAASNPLSFTVDSTTLKPISLTISATRLILPYNGSTTVSGTLRDAATNMLLTDKLIYLEYTYDPSDYDSWEDLTSGVSSTGQFSASATNLTRRTYLSWYFDGDSTYDYGWSADLKIMTRARLLPPSYPSTVRRGVTVAAWGTLQPLHSAAQNQQSHTKIYFSRYSRGAWRSEGWKWAAKYRNTSTATQYKVSCPFNLSGSWRARAVHQDADHAKTVSAWRNFKVR